jgi:hypothetical protein
MNSMRERCLARTRSGRPSGVRTRATTTRIQRRAHEPLRDRSNSDHRQAARGEREAPGRGGERCPPRRPKPSRAKPLAVAPRRELGAQRLPDANEVEPLSQGGEADVVGGNAQRRSPECPFALLDRLPALLDRREVPVATLCAHRPQPPSGRIERQPSADGKVLDDVVRAELGVAEEAGGVHGRIIESLAPPLTSPRYCAHRSVASYGTAGVGQSSHSRSCALYPGVPLPSALTDRPRRYQLPRLSPRRRCRRPCDRSARGRDRCRRARARAARSR